MSASTVSAVSTTRSSAMVTRESLLEGARALVPTLRARRKETNELRRLPDATVQDLRKLGVLGVATPAALGGSDLGIDVLLDVAIELGRGDGSTAWCAANWATHNFFVTMFPEQARKEVFRDKNRLPVVATGFSPLRSSAKVVEGGSMLNGQWDFASGVDHAEWVVLLGINENGPVGHLVPRSELKLIDTWHTTGMRGSGSIDVAVKDLFVPEPRLLGMIPPGEGMSVAREVYGTPFTRIPLSSYFGVGVIGPILGMASGALEVFIERTTGNIGGLSGVKVGTRPDVQYKIGESATEIDAAITIVRATYAEMRRFGTEQLPVTPADRLRWRRDQAYAAKLAVEATERLFQVGGAHVVGVDDLLNQFRNDISVASHHYSSAWSTLFQGYGRFALGLPHEVAMV